MFNDLPEPNRDAIHVLRKILDIEQPDLERILRENKFT